MARLSPGGLARYSTKGAWHPYPFLLRLNALLMGIAAGTVTRVIVCMPPRHGKSTLVSRYFPAWYTGMFPDRRVLLASYEGNFAASWGLKAKDEAEQHGRRLFGVEVRREVASSSNWQYKGREGGMSTAGVGGPFTGKGGNVLIIDDPIKNAEEARSKARRDLVWDWYNSTAYTRLEPGGAVLIVNTRWNEDDLAGRLISEMARGGERYEVVSFAALAEEGDVLGRPAGAALCPERFDGEALGAIRARLGSYWFGALYQQRPRPEEGNIFKAEWFGRYRGEPVGERIRRTQVIDSAHKVKKENDYSTITTLDTYPQGIFVRHVWREKVTYPDLKRAAGDMFRTWGPDELCIEDKDAGAMLIQELQRDTALPIIAVKAVGDKVARAHAATPMCEAGKVFVPAEDEGHPWLADWLEEVLAFPNGSYDDQVDGLVHGLNRLKELGEFLPDVSALTVDTGFQSIRGELLAWG